MPAVHESSTAFHAESTHSTPGVALKLVALPSREHHVFLDCKGLTLGISLNSYLQATLGTGTFYRCLSLLIKDPYLPTCWNGVLVVGIHVIMPDQTENRTTSKGTMVSLLASNPPSLSGSCFVPMKLPYCSQHDRILWPPKSFSRQPPPQKKRHGHLSSSSITPNNDCSAPILHDICSAPILHDIYCGYN